jgi:iron only hydrogenase large subunit-like protein
VFSLAPQAVASLAARFSVSLRAAYAAAAEYAKANFHATHVVDLSMAARLEALEAGREFVERYRAAAMADSGVKSLSVVEREERFFFFFFFFFFFLFFFFFFFLFFFFICVSFFGLI